MGTRPKLLIKFSMPIRLTPKNTVSTVFEHSSIILIWLVFRILNVQKRMNDARCTS